MVTEPEREEKKSRSQIKREFLELKELGKQLVALSPGQLRGIPLSPGTREAVLAAKDMARGALQRQFRHLAHLIEEEDVASIRDALSGALQPHVEEVAGLHETERWRDQLLSGEEDALTRFMGQHPEADRQRLRQLVRNAKKERDLDKPPRSARQLFRYLKSLTAGAG